MNSYINITAENIETEHLCCAVGDPNHQDGVCRKKEWMKQRIAEGHVFRKLDARGKVFVEFAPGETAWVPVCADGFLYIYCLWVSGSFKAKGYAGELISYVIDKAKKEGKKGVCTISSKKKKPFISEKKFFEHYGFKAIDSIGDFELLSLDFADEKPFFATAQEKCRSKRTASPFFTVRSAHTP